MGIDKQGASVGSATVDPVKSQATAMPLEPVSLANKPAPGQTGPRGMQPRQTYSRVNTGIPPSPTGIDMAQKQSPIRGMEFLPAKTAETRAHSMTTTARPTVQNLLKEAMEGTLSRIDVNAAVEGAVAAEDDETAKVASAGGESPTTDYINKLAGALDYCADLLEKEAADSPSTAGTPAPGTGPNATQVLESDVAGTSLKPGESGQASAANQPPKNPSTQPEQVQAGNAGTGLESNDATTHPEQPTEPIPNEKAPIAPAVKTASANLLESNKAAFAKLAGKAPAAAPVALIKKLAADAESPAQISSSKGPPAAEPPAAASGSEDGPKPAVPSDVSSQARLVSSNQAAIDYTKRDAKADPKKDLKAILKEAPLSASTDSVLKTQLTKTDEAGAKIASIAESATKTAAARVLLSRLVKQAEEDKKDEKEGKDGEKGKSDKSDKKSPFPFPPKAAAEGKEKESMGMGGGGAPSNPAAASGFSASSL